MNQILLAAGLLFGTLTTDVHSSPASGWGTVVRYSPGVMEGVRDYRNRVGQIKTRWDVSGWASVPQCSKMGQLVYIWQGGKRYSFQVVDCAETRDYNRQVRHGLWTEIDHEAAQWIIGTAGRAKRYVQVP